jgi:hypothetical protein
MYEPTPSPRRGQRLVDRPRRRDRRGAAPSWPTTDVAGLEIEVDDVPAVRGRHRLITAGTDGAPRRRVEDPAR